MCAMDADTEGVPGPYDVFVCYNGEDEEDAVRIADRLEAENLLVFNAAKEIKAGERFTERVEEALKNAKSTLVIYGKRGGQGWAKLEIDLALQENRERRMPIIPVYLPNLIGEPDRGLLDAFNYIDLRQNAERGWNKLLVSIREAASVGTPVVVVLPPRRPPRSPWWRPPMTPITMAIAGAAALVLVLAVAQTRAWLWARAQQGISQQIGSMIDGGDWDGIERLAARGAVAVDPLDQRLLAEYHGEGTARAVTVLLAIARRQPKAACPRLAEVVALGGTRRDPVLTYEEVLPQLDGSPCAGRADLRDARAAAARLVGEASASAQGFAALARRFADMPPFDCAALERVRALLAVAGPRACGASPALGRVGP